MKKHVEHGIGVSTSAKANAKPVSVQKIQPKKRIGLLAGNLTVPDDFDDSLPDDILQEFMGENVE